MAGIGGTQGSNGRTMSDKGEVNARIVYWGVDGGGKTTSVETIHAKLRPDHRGELKRIPTRLDPTVRYDSLPITLGNVQGVRTQLQIIAVPGGPEHAHTRKQLLDRADGIVIVVDAEPKRAGANVESVKELREALAAYGRSLDEIPFVVQYNKCDLCDPYAIEGLHRKLAFGSATVFETVAREGKGVLQVLSTISKSVIRALREAEAAGAVAPVRAPAAARASAHVARPVASVAPAVHAAPARRPVAPVRREPDLMSEAEPLPDLSPEAWPHPGAETVVELDAEGPAKDAQAVMEAAILSEGDGDAEMLAVDGAALRTELAFDRPFDQLAAEKPAPGARFGADLRVVSVGTAVRHGARGVRVPLVLGNDDGETLTLALTVQLDPLLEGSPGSNEDDSG